MSVQSNRQLLWTSRMLTVIKSYNQKYNLNINLIGKDMI